MAPDIVEIQTVEQLHTYVHHILCQKENLLSDGFATRAWTLKRGGRACGLQFALQGPRCVKLSAIWVADQNVIYFYDTRGQRYRKERLPNRPTFCSGAA